MNDRQMNIWLSCSLASLAMLAIGCADVQHKSITLHPASSMVRLTGPSAAPRPAPASRYDLELARNERQAFQVLVQCPAFSSKHSPSASTTQPAVAGVQPGILTEAKPIDHPVAGLRITSYQVHSIRNDVPAEHPQFKVPPRNLGWVPDVCLPAGGGPHPAEGGLATFFFDVHAPADLPIDKPTRFDYRLEFNPAPATGEPSVLRLSVLVHPFQLPRRLPFRTSVTWNWGIEKYLGRTLTPEERRAYLDFFMDHRFTPASFWSRGPDFSEEEVRYLAGRGANVFQVIANLGKRPLTEAQKRDLRPKLAAWRTMMKSAGAIDDCYSLIADEPTEAAIPIIRENALFLKQAFPELRIWVASAPRRELLDVVDVWDVVTAASTSFYTAHQHTSEGFRLARLAPNRPEYWWFYSVEPYAPHPNARLDDQLVDSRAIGALSYAQGVDGFEYFWASDWADNAALRDVPWPAKAAKWKSPLAGAGVLCYPGDDGRPVPSLRLINLRDAMQDWAALRMAGADQVQALRVARDPAGLARLRHEIYEQLSREWMAR